MSQCEVGHELDCPYCPGCCPCEGYCAEMYAVIAYEGDELSADMRRDDL